MLKNTSKFLKLIQCNSEIIEEFAQQGVYVFAFLWWWLDGVLYIVQVSAQDLLIEGPDTVNLINFFLCDRVKPIMARVFRWGENCMDPMQHRP